MDALSYLQQRMDRILATAGRGDPVELACSRHELRGAASALQAAGLLSEGEAQALLDSYDERLRGQGYLRQVTAHLGASTAMAARGSSETPSQTTSGVHDPGRLERVVVVATPMGTIAGQQVTGLLAELWTDLLVFHYHVRLEPSQARSWHAEVHWEAEDDHGSVHPRIRGGAHSAAGGLRGQLDFAGPIAAGARRLTIRASDRTGESATTSIDVT